MESNVQSVKYNYMKGWIVVFAILFVLAILAGVVFNVTTIGSKKLEIAVSSSATDVLSNNKVRDILKDKYKVSVKETYYSDNELIKKELLTNNKKIYNGIIFGDKKYLDYIEAIYFGKGNEVAISEDLTFEDCYYNFYIDYIIWNEDKLIEEIKQDTGADKVVLCERITHTTYEYVEKGAE